MVFEEQEKIYDVIRRKKHSKHLTVFFPETVNIKKMAIITANTKKCGQITLNPIHTLGKICDPNGMNGNAAYNDGMCLLQTILS